MKKSVHHMTVDIEGEVRLPILCDEVEDVDGDPRKRDGDVEVGAVVGAMVAVVPRSSEYLVDIDLGCGNGTN